MEEVQPDSAADVMLRIQVITSLRQLAVRPSYAADVDAAHLPDYDMYASAAKKALRSLQAAHPQLFD